MAVSYSTKSIKNSGLTEVTSGQTNVEIGVLFFALFNLLKAISNSLFLSNSSKTV
jgi:hypothetical protein